MGYWYCKAKVYEWKEIETKTEIKDFFWVTKTKIKKEHILNSRFIEGKVLCMGMDGGMGSFNNITIVTKEGKNPQLEMVSYELGSEKEYGKWDGPRVPDEILELNWVD